jgi:hypothetical protein
VARALHLQKNLAPFITLGGVPDEIARAARNINFRDSTAAQEAIEFASPFQKTVISPKMARRQAEKTERNIEVYRSNDPAVVLGGKREALNPQQRKARDVIKSYKKKIRKQTRKARLQQDKELRKANKIRRKQSLKIRERLKKLRGE